MAADAARASPPNEAAAAPRARSDARSDARRAGGVREKLREAAAEEAARHPGAVIEAFATDEHRVGLKPVLRRVWTPRGERPTAVGHHRFEWPHVAAFVSPATGESFRHLSTGVFPRATSRTC